jgi:hypothetical protein
MREGMSINPIQNISTNYIQSILNSTLQGAGLTTSGTGSTTATGTQADNGQLSPLGQVLSTLQQLQQSNPTQYQQVTQQIATNLQSAAQTAQANGNTAAATQLNQLASDFTKASQSGQLPSIQDLAQAAGGHHHHHMHAQGGSSDSSSGTNSSSTTSDSSNSSNNQTISQLLAAFQSNAAQSDALNPMSIILNTLGSSGIGQ